MFKPAENNFELDYAVIRGIGMIWHCASSWVENQASTWRAEIAFEVGRIYTLLAPPDEPSGIEADFWEFLGQIRYHVLKNENAADASLWTDRYAQKLWEIVGNI